MFIKVGVLVIGIVFIFFGLNVGILERGIVNFIVLIVGLFDFFCEFDNYICIFI